ncbi:MULTISPECIES: HAD family hydrolase [unclassified Paenibacillus]|uniref:HAD family hydrolase n=1 Tax=unclassified Paenibacillus TaxID=185978 RepID=UPI001AE8529D|nr:MULTISPECIES: HAD family hydrolase [unclassified Paenibacillus]MBP1154591.1 Cof subfamily protein (haloacid dehalogenase superfamily) [Paenibacillus sp. PvP091]MBP1170025.1 Cof subfamily protein (haloacid dehalogenase superfamily) [Paenibacillus sp. PvR098]MBP2441053.1 Cof subfamily protein (haloacid dehalogenase superfamily) [Paenibacillus sp. PvP052]
MIRLIVSDLDGTLLHKHKAIRPEDRQALHEAKAEGITVAFASGRMRPEIISVMKDLGIAGHAISQNGAYVHTSDGNLIHQSAFERELIADLAQAASGTPFVTMIAAPDSYVVERWSERVEQLRSRLFAPLVEMKDLQHKLGRDLVCGKISYMGEVDELLQFQKVLKTKYGEAIDAYISDVDCMDVMPRHTSKGTGLLSLLEHLGMDREEAACFGDSFNDLSMFAVTPHSFAMAASHPDVQAKAAHTIQNVAEALEWIRSRNAALHGHPNDN